MSPGENEFNLKKTGKKFLQRKTVINCHCTCYSWIFCLCFMSLFPIFPYICQFQRFLHNFMQNIEKLLRVQIEKFSYLIKISTGVGVKKQGGNYLCFRRGKNWKSWARYLLLNFFQRCSTRWYMTRVGRKEFLPLFVFKIRHWLHNCHTG